MTIAQNIKQFIANLSDETVAEYHSTQDQYLWVEYNVLDVLEISATDRNVECAERHLDKRGV